MNVKKAGKVPSRKYAQDNFRLPSNTPILGLGCSSFSAFFSSPDEELLTVDTMTKDNNEVKGWVETIRHAVLHRGITLLDTAPWYGHGISEVTLGYAFDSILEDNVNGNSCSGKNAVLPKIQKRKRTGTLPRSCLIINTKIGRYESHPLYQFDFSYDTTIRSVHRSLKRMNCTYIDVIQLHDPEFVPSLSILMEETIPALLECRKRGWAKAIGLTGYPLEVQHQILVKSRRQFGDESVFDQSLVYCHNNLHDMSLFSDHCFPSLGELLKQKEGEVRKTNAIISYAQFCQQSNIHLMAAAPLSMGLLTPSGPPSWHPASSPLKDACYRAAKMSDSKGVNISSLALLYSLSQQGVCCTLLGMKDVKEVNVAADLAMRFCNVNFDSDDNGNTPTINTILHQVLSSREMEALALILDKNRGPFAEIPNGEYRWDGKEEARKFWALADKFKKENEEKKSSIQT